MIRVLILNIYVRNGIFIVLMLVLARITNDSGDFSSFSHERFKVYFSYVVDYFWIFVHNKVLLERFLLKKKIKEYLILLAVSYLAYQPFFYYFNSPFKSNIGAVFTSAMNLTAIKLLGVGLYFIVKYFIDKDRFYKASLTAKEQELEILKAQLNPHFLFNALNNIYSHLISDGKNGQELILKLSELMRYIVDSSIKKNVSIGEEIKFIENYISFEKERLGDRCEIIFTKNVIDERVRLAPLILFTFIENAFKHGTQSIQKSVVKIELTCKEELIELKTQNQICSTVNDSTKTGLKNTKRRLEILYPDQHKLFIEKMDENFNVRLNISQ